MSWGGINSPYRRVGTFVLTEEATYRRSYETASWWTEITVAPGEYEIESNGYYARVKLPGVITDEYFVNRLLNHTAVAEKRDVGKDATHVWRCYSYELAALATTQPDTYRLDDGWTVSVRQWGGEGDSLSDGRRRAAFKLVREEE